MADVIDSIDAATGAKIKTSEVYCAKTQIMLFICFQAKPIEEYPAAGNFDAFVNWGDQGETWKTAQVVGELAPFGRRPRHLFAMTKPHLYRTAGGKMVRFRVFSKKLGRVVEESLIWSPNVRALSFRASDPVLTALVDCIAGKVDKWYASNPYSFGDEFAGEMLIGGLANNMEMILRGIQGDAQRGCINTQTQVNRFANECLANPKFKGLYSIQKIGVGLDVRFPLDRRIKFPTAFEHHANVLLRKGQNAQDGIILDPWPTGSTAQMAFTWRDWLSVFGAAAAFGPLKVE